MPRSFVEQALARCSVDAVKFWFNCNPRAVPLVLSGVGAKAAGEACAALHFTMADNYSLSEDTKQRYERLYSGVCSTTVTSGAVW
jgi:hypothetical protein